MYDYMLTTILPNCALLRTISLEPAPLDILVPRDTYNVPPSLLETLFSSPLAPSAAYDIESQFYDASPGAPSRRRSRCKLLFASLEEIRLARRAPVEATDPLDGEDKG